MMCQCIDLFINTGSASDRERLTEADVIQGGSALFLVSYCFPVAQDEMAAGLHIRSCSDTLAESFRNGLTTSRAPKASRRVCSKQCIFSPTVQASRRAYST